MTKLNGSSSGSNLDHNKGLYQAPEEASVDSLIANGIAVILPLRNELENEVQRHLQACLYTCVTLAHLLKTGTRDHNLYNRWHSPGILKSTYEK